MRYKGIVVILIIFALVVSRFVFLEQDLPTQRLTTMNETDQYWYLSPAFNWQYANLDNAPCFPSDVRLLYDIFQNLFTYPFLLIFGNTLFAIKFAIAILSLLCLLVFYDILTLLNIRLNSILFAMIVFGFDFMQLVSARVQNPVIYSMFGCLVLFWIMLKYLASSKANKQKWLLTLGAWSCFIVFFIYIFNLFAAAAAFTFILIEAIKNKKPILKPLLILGSGFVIMFLFYNVFTYLTVERTIIDFINSLKNFAGGEDFRFIEEVNKSPWVKLKELIGGYFLINFFRLNLAYLVLLPILLGVIVKKSIKGDMVLSFILLILAFSFFQNYTESNYMSKKMTVLFPFLVIGFFYTIKDIRIVFNKVVTVGLIAFGVMLALYSFKMTSNPEYYNLWFGSNTSTTFNTINLACAFAIFVLSLFFVFKPLNHKLMQATFLVLLIIPSVFLSATELYTPTYYHRDALKVIAKKTENKTLANGYFYMLYRNGAPCLISDKLFLSPIDDFEQYEFDYLVFETIRDLEKKTMVSNIYTKEIIGLNEKLLLDSVLPFSQEKYLYLYSRHKN